MERVRDFPSLHNHELQMKIEFLDVFIHCGLDTVQKSGKYLCPFCGKYALVEYDDAKCHCHSCKFLGNIFRFYSQIKDIPYEEARSKLIEAYNSNKIKLHKSTPKEALKRLREDLHYLAMVRMYFSFYNSSRTNKKYYQQLSGIPQATFSRVINGDIKSTSREEWNRVIVFLRSKLDIDQFKRDLAKEAMCFNDEAYELLKSQSHKF